MSGLAEVHQAAYLAASLCCVGALAGLSSQTTSRLGTNLGIVSNTKFNIKIVMYKHCCSIRLV